MGGTTGEGQLMSWDEHIMLIAHTGGWVGGCARGGGEGGVACTQIHTENGSSSDKIRNHEMLFV